LSNSKKLLIIVYNWREKMAIISNILLVIFIPVCLLLILVVLLQAGKGGGLSGAFGGSGAQPFLGARGTVDFLSKLTIYLAIGFISLALILSLTYGPSRSFNVKEETPAVNTEDQTPQDSGTAKPAEAQKPASNATSSQKQPSTK